MKQLAPELVLDDGLLRALVPVFGMDTLYDGEGVRRDERGWIKRDDQGRKVSQPMARSLWVTEVRPAHMEPSCLAMIATEERRMVGMVIETHPWFAEYPPQVMPIVPPTLVHIGPVDLDATWDDPVADALGQMDGWLGDRSVALDGRIYALFAGNAESQVALTFANPVAPALLALERSLLQVAQMLVTHDHTGALEPYVQEWTRYTQIR